jgi:hypothetical protein
MTQPDYVKCIRSPFGEQKLTLCGRIIGPMEFVLLGVDHAYMLGDQASQQACPDCVDQAVRRLQESKYVRGD